MSLPNLVLNADEFCVIRCDIADKLLACADGDGALLYLYLLRKGNTFDERVAKRELGFDTARYDRAVFTLTSLELAVNPRETLKREQDEKAPAPVYKTGELRSAREADHRFAAVCQTAESVLGRTLTEGQLRTLFTIYDHLGLPADVIIELLTYLKGKKATVSRKDIEQEGYLWADMGLFSSKSAGEYLARRELEKPIMDKMLLALGIIGREAAPNEARFLSEFIQMGFPPDAVSFANARMKNAIGKFSWRYLKGILEKWHAKGVHTVSEITALEPIIQSKKTVAEKTYIAQEAPQGQLEDWEKQWLEEKKRNIERRKENSDL